ncbi:MAG: hypothetical protein ABW252_06915 [Polyangiales bacterium]
MGLTAFLFAALPVLGVPHAVGTLDVADTTSAYLRSQGKGETPAFDLDTAPEVSGTLAFRRTQLRADYAPRLTLRDVPEDDRAIYTLHNAAAAIRHVTPRFSLALGQTLSIGRQYFSNLGVLGIPAQTGTGETAVPTDSVTATGVSLLPGVRSLRMWSQQSLASVAYQWTPRWSTELRGSYLIAGGRGEVEQLLQPRRREGNAAFGLGYRISRRQLFSSVATFSRVLISNGFEHWLAGVGEDWDMQWSRTLRSSVNVGGVWRRTERPDGTEKTSFVPDAGAGLSYEAARGTYNLTLDANGAVSPLINTLTGELQLAGRGQLAGNLRWHDTSCSLSVDAYQTIPPNRDLATRLIGGGLIVGQLLTTWLSIGGAARLQHQRLEGSTLTLPLQWALSASLRAEVPTLYF